MVSVRKKGQTVTLIATSRGFPAELGKHPSNGRVNFDMVVDRVADLSMKSMGISISQFHMNNHSTLSVISLWLSEAL